MFELHQEDKLKLLICVFVCLTMLYCITYYEASDSFTVADDNSYNNTVPIKMTDKTPTHLQFWTNASMFDDIVCKSDNRITSCKYSTIKLLNVDAVTRTIEVRIHLYDGFKKKKTNGGDVILMWAVKSRFRGSVPGHVIDHMDGSYYGKVRVPWSGRTKIYIKLASAKENLCLRFKAMEQYGNSVFSLKSPYGIHYQFVNGSVIEYTRCVPHSFVYGYEAICNFTTLNFGHSWFCGRPVKQGLDCLNYNRFRSRPYNISEIVPNQTRDEIIQLPGHCIFQQSLTVNIKRTAFPENTRTLTKCSERPKRESWTGDLPSGYALNKRWRFINCSNALEFTEPHYIQCLNDKRIYFIGDSTLRQYLEVLAKFIKLNVTYYAFSVTAYSKKHNIRLFWRKHEMPFHNQELYDQHKVQSTDFQINKLANNTAIKGSSLVVVVHYGAHLQAFPPSVFRSRLRKLVNALRRLLQVKPEVTILVKGAAPVIQDTHWFDVRISLIFNEILFQEFSVLKDHVIYLDVFSVSVAFNNIALHPRALIVQNMIHQFMSYLC